PICKAPVPESARYPCYVCSACASRAKDSAGRPVEFFNTDLSGGIEGRYRDSHDPYPDQTCYIDGLECWADEARFGGIVIQPKGALSDSTGSPGE
ncbi:MAG TPA: hypothetical protein VLZ81_01050, partial [Blastocatellia bacterium]|nr:hypothetical protein [Blastocatellia bacterium]